MKKLIKNMKYEFRNNYYADDNGHIWSEYKQDYLTEYNDKNGYQKVVLMTTDKPASKGHRFSIHRLILATFLPCQNMEELQVDHIDGDIKNNKLINLRWTTCKENLENNNTKPNRRVYDQEGTHNASAKLDQNDLKKLVEDINSGSYTRKQIQEKYSICPETLRKICDKITYKEELLLIPINPIFVSDYARDTKGEKNGRAKLDNNKVAQIIKLLQTKQYSYSEIGKMFDVTATTICAIRNKESWKHLTKNIIFN